MQQMAQIVSLLWNRKDIFELLRMGRYCDCFSEYHGTYLKPGGNAERGLLNVAFPPNYESTGKFYIYYTSLDGDVTIARYTVSGNPDVANPSGEVILTILHPGHANHNGGGLVFGPDGFLYISTGDGGGSGDADGNAQDLDLLLGKILRLM